MRAFIAVELPSLFRFEVAGLARQLAQQVDGRFMPPDNYHLTLAFLGDIDEHDVCLAMDALDAASAGIGPIDLRSEGLGTFGDTLWMGLRATDSLMAASSCVREELVAHGVPFDDKQFVPHITLARRARITVNELPPLPFPNPDEAHVITLFKSALSSEGATYSAIFSKDVSF